MALLLGEGADGSMILPVRDIIVDRTINNATLEAVSGQSDLQKGVTAM